MKPYHRNPRQISKKEYNELKASLDKLGDLGGIVHNIRTDEIIGGNQRENVFGEAQQVEVIETYDKPDRQGTIAHGFVIWRGAKYSYRQVDWDEPTAAEANIRANLTGGKWDFEVFANQWDIKNELTPWGFDDKLFQDWQIATGALGVMLGSEEEPPEEGDAEPQTNRAEELRELWGVETGQMWAIGEHRLICGDCTDKAVVDRVMGGERVEALLTDPPYGIGSVMQGGSWAKKEDTQFGMMREWDNTTSQLFFDTVVSFNAPCVVWGGNYFITPPSRCWLVWNKPEFPSVSSSELAWTNLDANTKRIECNRTHQEDGEKDHATQKPVKVMQWSLGFLPPVLTLDPFSGSGTTLVACQNLSRRCRAIEISPTYCAVILQRMSDAFPGIDIHLIEDAA